MPFHLQAHTHHPQPARHTWAQLLQMKAEASSALGSSGDAPSVHGDWDKKPAVVKKANPSLLKQTNTREQAQTNSPWQFGQAAAPLAKISPAPAETAPARGAGSPGGFILSTAPGAGGKATSAAWPRSWASPCSQLALRPTTAGENTATTAPKAPPPSERL